jgi:hypothetical protein
MYKITITTTEGFSELITDACTSDEDSVVVTERREIKNGVCGDVVTTLESEDHDLLKAILTGAEKVFRSVKYVWGW